ncbi:hypothetical protein DPEC_G00043010 [Dallia pectoralis]|uniref:Uncharacterized protein n=1 Tax=Dallia pectoralis TaxID=75939 RepID=A0ACC2H915_DALPE|nr:hypothetical protein DPEC_G00043010 [Dallia pectoralis]
MNEWGVALLEVMQECCLSQKTAHDVPQGKTLDKSCHGLPACGTTQLHRDMKAKSCGNQEPCRRWNSRTSLILSTPLVTCCCSIILPWAGIAGSGTSADMLGQLLLPPGVELLEDPTHSLAQTGKHGAPRPVPLLLAWAVLLGRAPGPCSWAVLLGRAPNGLGGSPPYSVAANH